jgi:hypothetical protein
MNTVIAGQATRPGRYKSEGATWGVAGRKTMGRIIAGRRAPVDGVWMVLIWIDYLCAQC